MVALNWRMERVVGKLLPKPMLVALAPMWPMQLLVGRHCRR